MSCHGKRPVVGDGGIVPPDRQDPQKGVNVTVICLNETFDEVRVMITLTFKPGAAFLLTAELLLRADTVNNKYNYLVWCCVSL